MSALPTGPARPRPVVLAILDGWGWREPRGTWADDATWHARTPTFDALWEGLPRGFLRTSGRDVGLPDGQMGNSEVGHLNIGAGRVVVQDLPRITAACEDGSIADLPPVRAMVARLRTTGGALHLCGLLSPGGVHAHMDHAVALARAFDAAGVRVKVHAWTDGRDTPPRSALDDLAAFAAAMPRRAEVATVCGRYWAMDRDGRWERVEKAWRAMALGEGLHTASAAQAITNAYGKDTTDEFVPATVVDGYGGVRDGDGLLCFNFRADRSRQILEALADPRFGGFLRPRMPRLAMVAGMVPYSDALDALGLAALFPPVPMGDLLGEAVSRAGLKQLRMAETEKYPHVTYFLNGGREEPLPGEDRLMVPSPKVATYDLKPEMSAPELAERAEAAIRARAHDLVVVNFANADMVGHTGSLPAAVAACEAVDAGLARLAAAVRETGGAMLATADHGNAEQMVDPDTGEPHTAHTTNPVPVLLLGGPPGVARLSDGRLADVAPTLLALLGLPQSAAMTGRSLLAPVPAVAAAAD